MKISGLKKRARESLKGYLKVLIFAYFIIVLVDMIYKRIGKNVVDTIFLKVRSSRNEFFWSGFFSVLLIHIIILFLISIFKIGFKKMCLNLGVRKPIQVADIFYPFANSPRKFAGIYFVKMALSYLGAYLLNLSVYVPIVSDELTFIGIILGIPTLLLNLNLFPAEFILMESLDKSIFMVIKESTHLMRGHKIKLVRIYLSFAIWFLLELTLLSCIVVFEIPDAFFYLCGFLFVVLFLYLFPYLNCVLAEFYLSLKKESETLDTSSIDEIHYEAKKTEYIRLTEENSGNIWKRIFAVFGVFMIIVFVILTMRSVLKAGIKSAETAGMSLGEIEITEESMKKYAIDYLNSKYPDSNYTSADILHLEAYEGILDDEERYKWQQGKTLGYKGELTDEKHTQIILIIDINELTEKKEVKCFDSRQKDEIVQDLLKDILIRTKQKEGQAYLSVDVDGFFTSLIDESVYHIYYQGNLTEFFRTEAEFRNKILIDTGDEEMKSLKDMNTGNINGRCMVYFPDPDIQTVAQCLENNTRNLKIDFQVLQEMSKEYQIHMIGTVLPGQLYHSFFDSEQNNDYSSVRNWLEEGGNFLSGFEIIPPVISPLMTACYVSEAYYDYLGIDYGGEYIPEAVALSEGFYVLPSDVSINERGKPQDASDIGELQMRDMPDSMEEYLKNKDISLQNAISFSIISKSESKSDYILAIDKEKFHITENGYKVAVTTPETKYSEETCGTLNIKSYTDINRKAACEGEGYLFLDYHAVQAGEPPVVVTIIP
jgi:hypothetical protein